MIGLIIFMMYGNTLCVDIKKTVDTRNKQFKLDMLANLEEGED